MEACTFVCAYWKSLITTFTSTLINCLVSLWRGKFLLSRRETSQNAQEIWANEWESNAIYFRDARVPLCTTLASLTSSLLLLSFRSCEISCNWKCLTAWRMKKNPQLPHWEWTVTTVILQHSTTAPNHSPWLLKRRIRKPGFALSSQEEGIKVKYQCPGIQKGPVYSFLCTFFLG